MHVPGRGAPAPGFDRPVVLFDGDCAFCTRSMALVSRAFGSGWYAVDNRVERFGLSRRDVDRAAWWVETDRDGRLRTVRGARVAAAILVNRGGIFALAGVLLLVPPFSWLASAGYLLVAANRGRLHGRRDEPRDR